MNEKKIQTTMDRKCLVSIEERTPSITNSATKTCKNTILKTILILSLFFVCISLIPHAEANHIVSFQFSQYNLNDGEPGFEVIITVNNATANVDPLNQDTVSVIVTSTSDSTGVPLVLTETGINTGVFQNTNLLFTTGDAKYEITDTVNVSIVDNSINNPLVLDTSSVEVRSTSDSGGITLSLTETEIDSGEFTGTLTFSSSASSSATGTILVAAGDVLSIEYIPTNEIAHGLIIPNPNPGINAISAAPGDTITATYFGDVDTATMSTTGPGTGSGGAVRPGLVLDFIAAFGGGCSADCIPPTLGITKFGERIVEKGFSYNGNAVDAELFYTPFPLITVEVGKQNLAILKVYENYGIENIRHIGLGFGLEKNQAISESKAIIEYDISFDGTTKTSVYDPNNALGNVTVVTIPTKCKVNDAKENCLEVQFYHTFRESLEFNIVGTNVWDERRNGWQNYFNDGVEIVGNSLNPPKKIQVLDRLGYPKTITIMERNVGADEEGNIWYNENGIWSTEYKIPPRDDPITTHGIDRNNDKFKAYCDEQIIKAQKILDEMVGFQSIANSYFGINDNEIILYTQKNRSEDPELQKQLVEEQIKAAKIFQNKWPGIFINFQN